MPWNEQGGDKGPWGGGPTGQGGNGNGGSPWNRPSGGGQGGRPDFEEQVRKMQERFRGRGGRGGQGGGGGRSIGPLGFLVAGVIALLAWASTGIVVVDAGQQAAIFRFGQWQTNFGPGLHVHLPAPVEQHVIIDVEASQEVRIGRNSNESLMLTQDENIADIEFTVKWKVKADEPQNFILNVKEPEQAVSMVAESVMREVVGKSLLQPLITNERDPVAQQVRLQIQTLLDEYRAGILIEGVQIAKADPPSEVIEAFNDVNKAQQDAETTINQATQVANRVVPEARGTASRLIQQAEGYRDQVIADATGQASRFDQIYDEYRKAPQVTRERMFLETIERVLERSDKIILGSESGAVPYLPIEPQRGRPTSGSGE
ncbi:MAG: FtsH protease activity modulator HflK [Pseudomonadota bacterium]